MSSNPPCARRLLVSPFVLAAVLIAVAIAPKAAEAQSNPCAPPVTNPIACENTLPGTPASVWQVFGAGDDSIQGFATQMSVNKGEAISFKVESTTPNYRIDIYRLGYYGGDGARLVASNLAPTGPSTQPACLTDSDSGLIDCGNWSVSRSWTVPSTAVSGVYIANLKRNDGGGESQIIFVVRDDARSSDVVVQTSDTTWQAYNKYGGNSLYACTVACPPGNPLTYKAAYKVSYNRPLDTEHESALFTGAEYSMIRFLEANGYDASYISGVDANSRPSTLLGHKLFISSGHDEYWSAAQRANVEAARDAGVSLAFFSGNEMFWKTRFEPSLDSSHVADRTLVSYKDTHFSERQDPVAWTGTWHDPRFTSESENVEPPNALVGQNFVVNSGTSRITVPAAYRQLRMWRNTAVTSLAPNESLPLGVDTLGYEWDEDVDNGFRPAGQFRLSSTTVSGVEAFTDYGSTTQFNSTRTHNLTMYRAPSGARVFGAGTVQWAWGLDDWNPGDNPADRNMQQATVNLFADMGVQPYALLPPGLEPASASTDDTAPTATINSLPGTIADGTRVTISGSATDGGGGVVAGVEVSTDGGATWRMAAGTANWSYSWLVHGHPTANVKVRAVDDSGNLAHPGAGVNVNVSCPCSIWGSGHAVPAAEADLGDPTPIEVGVKFKSDRFGTISGIRFYKGAGNTGTHVGSLWTTDGQRLAAATFTNETATGWQSVTFPNPVEVQPDTTYIASYHAPNGHYAGTPFYFYRAPAPTPAGGAIVDSPPLHAINNTGSTTNGVYSYGGSPTFPANTYNAANYWVDVMFTSIPPPGQVTNVTAAAGGATKANVSWSAPTSGGSVTSYQITPYIGSDPQTPTTVPASATSKAVTGLTTGTTYTFSVRAVNPNGTGPESTRSGPVTPLGPVVPAAPTNVAAEAASNEARVTWTAPANDGDSAITHQTVTPYVDGVAQDATQVGASATTAMIGDLANGTTYTFKVTATNGVGTSAASAASNAVTPQATIFDLATPQTVDSDDPSAVELGVRFRSDEAGTITGIRFYKAIGNTGTHVGSLWSADGTRLAQVTFTGESASGWQTATFANPVQISANTTYVASYFAPNGHYSATVNGLASAVDNPPLHALSNGDGGNGVYNYSATSTFPNKSWSATNYFVDVLFAVPPPGQVTNATAAETGSGSARVAWSAPSSGGPAGSYRITPYIGSTPQTPTTVAAPATSKIVSGLATGTTYTFTVRALNANGSGPASAHSNAVTPQAPVVPFTPTGVGAQPASRSVRVTWERPSDGDDPITGQTVTPYVNGVAQSATQVGASASSVTITGLTNGVRYTFKVTATNSIGTSAPSAASNEVIPRATIFDFAAPAAVDTDTLPIELGVKFQADTAGVVTGVRFHKAAGNTGTHVGSLWSSGGERLAQATFTGESASGWQHVTFANAVEISANTTYVASYFAPNGHYSATGGAFSSGVDTPPLRALGNAASPNGVYAYSGSSTFPNSSWNATNYGVDVMFAPPPEPGQVTGVAATAGAGSASLSWSAPSDGGTVTSYRITPHIGSSAQTPTTITGSPPATSHTIGGLSPGTAYTFTVQALNAVGPGPVSAHSNAVTPQGVVAPAAPTGVSAQGDSKSAVVDWTAPTGGDSPVTGYTVTPFVGAAAETPVVLGASTTRTKVTGLANGTSYTFKVKATNAGGTGPDSHESNAVTPRASIFELATPTVIDADDPGSVVLGVKFRADVDGVVTGIRFYKAAANTGTHIGSLWTEGGQLLDQAVFTNETPSGWQSVTFASPVSVSANTTYVASYLAPNGHYSVTGAAFASNPADNPPLHALANPVSSNGVYRYSGSAVFPTNSFNSANYWVDVLFAAGS
jgi:Domain of unknown function (DUF4082)/Fibronectin type III domain